MTVSLFSLVHFFYLYVCMMGGKGRFFFKTSFLRLHMYDWGNRGFFLKTSFLKTWRSREPSFF